MTSFSIFTFGTASTASSRLRAHRLGDYLTRHGHTVLVNDVREFGEVSVFQKNTDFATAEAALKAGSRIVFDVDDNIFERTRVERDEALKFINIADRVSVGSGYLKELLGRIHPDVFLFDNPLDVSSEALTKKEYDWQARLVWFGSAANQYQLFRIETPHPVTRITAGGDIEWRLETIDQTLIGFDLAVLPVSIDQWTVAKNANKAQKCLSLGLPFIASRTAEHEELCARLRLPDWFLVEDGQDWAEAIDAYGRRYAEAVTAVRRARPAAIDAYGEETIYRTWLFNVLGEGTRAPAADPGPLAADTDVVLFNDGSEADLVRSLTQSEVDLHRFRSLTIVSATPVGLARHLFRTATIHEGGGGFLDAHRLLAQAMRDGTGRYCLYLRAGLTMKRGAALALGSRLPDIAAQAGDGPLAYVINSQYGPTGVSAFTQPPVTPHDLVGTPIHPEFVVMNRACARAVADWVPHVLHLWPLMLLLRALGDGGIRAAFDPDCFAFSADAYDEVRPVRLFHALAAADNPEEVTEPQVGALDLIGIDLAHQMLDRCRDALADHWPGLMARMLAQAAALRRTAGEVNGVKAQLADQTRRLDLANQERAKHRDAAKLASQQEKRTATRAAHLETEVAKLEKAVKAAEGAAAKAATLEEQLAKANAEITALKALREHERTRRLAAEDAYGRNKARLEAMETGLAGLRQEIAAQAALVQRERERRLAAEEAYTKSKEKRRELEERLHSLRGDGRDGAASDAPGSAARVAESIPA